MIMTTAFKRGLRTVLCVLLAFTVAFSVCDSVEAKAKAKSKAKASKKPVKSVVIVLDPGHDTAHHGTNYQGFDEGSANLAIANYCKQELESYNGVKVFLTRTTLDCPYGANPDSTADCLAGRVNYAASVGASAIISLHNDYDSDLDPSVGGSKVIIPNASYRPDICLAGLSLAQQILPQLTATGLGINNWKLCPNGTGIVTRNSGVSTYPDGSPKDYYALINKAKTAGIPCVIVEHAYCTNPSDLANHLSTPEQLQQLGIADARGIAAYFGLSK